MTILRYNTLAHTVKMALFAALASSSGYSVAGGSFALTTQSFSALGQANAGLGVLQNDASAVYTNPANMAGHRASAGLAYIKPETTFTKVTTATRSQSTDTTKGDMIPDSVAPSAYYTRPVDVWDGVEKTTVGIGAYSAYGFNADYEDTFAGRGYGDKSKLKTITIAPAVAYHHSDALSLGMSVNITRAEGELSSAISKVVQTGATTFIQVPDSNGWKYSVEGDDTSVGYTLGANFQANPNVKLALVHRSKQKFKLDGTVVADASRLARGIHTSKASLDITLPNSTELSAGLVLGSKANLYTTITHTDWSVFDQIQVKTNFNQAELTPKVGATLAAGFTNPPAEVQKYKDSYAYAVGGDVQVSPKVKLRGGVAYEETPIQDKYRSVRLPSSNRWVYSLGGNVGLTEKLSLDLGVSYVDGDKAPLNQPVVPNPGKGVFQANATSSAIMGMAQLNYKF